VADEGFELEVVGRDGEAVGDVVSNSAEPGLLLGRKRCSGLCLLCEPVLKAVINGKRVRNKVNVGFDRFTNERNEVGELLTCGAADPAGFECFIR
jgi:hypothetical protein